MVQGSYIWDFKYSDRQPRNTPQMQGNALQISLDFQFGPIPAIFSAHAPGIGREHRICDVQIRHLTEAPLRKTLNKLGLFVPHCL